MAGGAFAELGRALINLVFGHEAVGELGGTSEDEHQQSGGVRIQGAAMPHFLDTELAPDLLDDVVRGWPAGFIDQQSAVEQVKLLHASPSGLPLFPPNGWRGLDVVVIYSKRWFCRSALE